jgi:hypothetical protein
MSWIRINGLNYKVPHQQLFEPVLRIRTDFNEHPDQALYLYVDPDPGSQNQCGSMRIRILVRLCHKKLDLDIKNVLYEDKIL